MITIKIMKAIPNLSELEMDSTHCSQTDCWDSVNNFTKLELVKNGGLARCIEPEHYYAHFLFRNKRVEQGGYGHTHDDRQTARE